MTTTTTTASSTKGLVAVLLDVTPAGWKGIGENKFLEAVKLATFFVNMHHGSTPTTLPDNSVIFHCYSQTSLIDIRPSDILSNGFSMHIDPQSVINELADFFESQATVEPEMTRSSSFSQCLSQVLCKINRVKSIDPSISAQIIVITPRQILAPQYIPMMNCIFAAAKLCIVDVIEIKSVHDHHAESSSPGVSATMQQLAHLTGGQYIPIVSNHTNELFAIFASIFAPEDQVKRSLRPIGRSTNTINLQPSCFCHGRSIDKGFVCSVCLSVFCSPIPVCAICKAKFEFQPVRTSKISSGTISQTNKL